MAAYCGASGPLGSDFPVCTNENKECLKRFIRTYESLPELWNQMHPDYKNKFKKLKALEKLLLIYKEIKPRAVIKDVTKKLNTLRSNYRRELNKIKSSMESGCDIYKPTSWVFYALNFLDDSEISSSLTKENEKPEESQGQRESLSYYIQPATSLFSSITPYTSVAKKKKIQTPIAKPIKLLPCNFSLNKNNNIQDDKFLNLAKVWAIKLKNLQPKQRKLAEKAINDILFEAEMETLHRDSVKINIGRNPSATPSSSPSSTPTPIDPSPVLQESQDLWKESQKQEQESQDHGENISDLLQPASSSFSSSTPNPPPAKKMKIEDTLPKRNELQETSDFLSNKNSNIQDVEYLNLAKVWVYKLKNLQLVQKKLAEKAINDILFEAEMETLQWDSVEINMMSADTSHPS